MGASMSLEDAAVSRERSYDGSRKVDYAEYLNHISEQYTLYALTIFPKHLFASKYLMLRHLSLAYHALSELPGEMPYYMPHLVSFDCSYNRLLSIPTNFGHFLHMQELRLGHNKLKVLPASMGQMLEMKSIDISHNRFEDFPQMLTKMVSLEQINVAFNLLSALPVELATLKNLVTIYCLMNRCKVPPQEICDKGTEGILIFLSGEADKETNRDADEGAAAQSNPVESAAANQVFKRVTSPLQDTLLKRLKPDDITHEDRLKTPLRVPDGATPFSDSELVDRVAGLVYGAALGDAIGLATEFMTREECQFYYGMNGERLSLRSIIVDRHRSKWRKGDWTDDTDQLILVLLSLIQWGGVVDEVDFAKKLLDWAEKGFSDLGDTMAFGIGATVGSVVQNAEFVVNPHAVAEKVWQGTDNAANGAVMRTSILGIPHFDDLDIVGDNAVRICRTTHHDPRCQASCASVSIAVALILQGKYDLSNAEQVELLLAEAAQRGRDLLTNKEHIKDFNYYTSLDNFVGVKCADPRAIGYTLKPLGAAWVAMRQTEDFKTLITELIMQGGDADTNATVAGALLGCKLGYSKLPAEWLGGLIPGNVKWLDKIVNQLLNMMGL